MRRAALLLFASLAALTGEASASGGELIKGTVALSPPPASLIVPYRDETLLQPQPVYASAEGDELVVRRRGGDGGDDAVVLRWPRKAPGQREWMPWTRVMGEVFLYVWRVVEEDPKGGWTDTIHAVDLKEKKQLWTLPIRGDARLIGERDGRTLVLHVSGSELAALDVATGKFLWRTPAGYSEDYLQVGTAAFYTTRHDVRRIDLGSGKTLWSLLVARLCGFARDEGRLFIVEAVPLPIPDGGEIDWQYRRYDLRFRTVDAKSGKILTEKSVGQSHGFFDNCGTRFAAAPGGLALEIGLIIYE